MIDTDEDTLGGELRRLAEALVPGDDRAATDDATNRISRAGHEMATASSRRTLFGPARSRPRMITLAAGLIMLAGVATTIAVWSTRDSSPATVDAPVTSDQLVDRVEMIVYISPGADPQTLDRIRAAIVNHDDVVDVGRLQYLDFEASLARARELLRGDEETLALLNQDNLPTQFLVWALPGRVVDLASVRDELLSTPSVQQVSFDGVLRSNLDPPLTTDPSPTAPSAPETTLESPQSLADDKWLIPTQLDPMITFNHAMVDGAQRTLTYASAELDRGFTITIAGPDLGFDDAAVITIDINSRAWRLVDHADDTTWLSTDIHGTAVQVVSYRLDRSATVAVVASLRLSDVTALPRPPIDLDPEAFRLAATDDDGGGAVTLTAVTDGQYYCVEIASGGSCVGTISDEIAIRPSQMLLSDGRAVAYGVTRSDVATVRLALSDGRTVDVNPQDVDDAFPANFYVAVGAYAPGLDVLSVTPLDNAGEEIPTLDVGP